MSNIRLLLDMGYQVDVAANFEGNSVWPKERIQEFRDQMKDLNIECKQLDFSRSPLKLSQHIKSYRETLQLINERKYSFIHTHTPIASAIVRIAARKTKTKVIYTAHGFHFYKGAPLKNWILFYPLEKWLSKYTDVLITINKEDYERARKKFRAKKTEYVPGVGVDTEKFAPRQSGRDKIRKELGLDDDRIMLLSVGELNENKNHKAVVQAIQGMDITYVVVGKGEREEQLRKLAAELGVDLRLTGFRSDVADFYNAADIYILPSLREGLNVSLMEAMASGLACAAGNIRGNRDLIDDEKSGFLFIPNKAEDIAKKLQSLITDNGLKNKGTYNRTKVQAFSKDKVLNVMSHIYSEQRER